MLLIHPVHDILTHTDFEKLRVVYFTQRINLQFTSIIESY